MTYFHDMKTERVRKHINDLISEGLKQMSNPALDDDMFKIWLDYTPFFHKGAAKFIVNAFHFSSYAGSSVQVVPATAVWKYS